MKTTKYKSEDTLSVLHSFLVNQKHGVTICVHDKKMVLVPRAKVVDEEMCYNMGYAIIEEPYTGGVIVADIGDIWIAHFGNIKNEFRKQFTDYMVEALSKKGLNACFKDNDILVDGFKVCGTARGEYSGIEFTGVHIGINTNLEDIKKICTKPMNKIPKGLGEYGITTEDIIELFEQFCELYKDREA